MATFFGLRQLISLAIFSLLFLSWQGAHAQPSPDSGILQPEAEIEVEIPSVNGQIRWSDVATEVADQLKLDRDSLGQMLPSGSVNLSSGSVMLTLMAINLTAGDAISFSIGKDKQGGQVLQVRCRRSFFTGIAATPEHPISKRPVVVDLDADWQSRSTAQPMVVFLHGMNSDAGAFDATRSAIREGGFATASIGYDFRQSIADSANESMVALKSVMGVDVQPPSLCLIGHSMGGLVARQMTESSIKIDSALNTKQIDQLITIGTPHLGSNWASLPPLSDMFTADGMDADDLVDVVLHRPSSRGIQDLIPGSVFLETLNGRPRRTDVRYTSIIGTASPISEAEARSLRETLQSLDQQGSMLRLIRPRIKPLLESFDELTAGRGDGMVSVESARIPGINDNIEIAVSHFEMILQDHVAGKNPVLEIVIDRLK
jgi:pimeloyl-ACP methyl ester carboxylesterase